MAGYATLAATGQHEVLFQTPALSLAVFAATKPMPATLKRWTEEILEITNQQTEGNRFFFCSLDVAKASPTEMFLTPV
jgi:hypothetical protein